MPTSVANVAAKSALGRSRTTEPLGAGLNVGETERLASLVGGGLLALYGIGCRGFAQVVLPLAGAALAYRGLSGHCHCYEALGVNTAGRGRTAVDAGHGVKVEASVLVNRAPMELYREWHQFDKLPRFMRHLREVKLLGGKKTRWVANAPLGMSVEWEAEIVTERPGQVIAWRSLPGSDVDTAGSVHFDVAEGRSGTEVRVTLKYDPPAGKVGAWVARLLGESPEQQIREDLLRFKEMMEAPVLAGGGQAAGSR